MRTENLLNSKKTAAVTMAQFEPETAVRYVIEVVLMSAINLCDASESSPIAKPRVNAIESGVTPANSDLALALTNSKGE
jgi:hypothetical protein